MAAILIQSLQADTLADSVIAIHQTMLEQIASEEFHIAQADAKCLLERIGIPQPYYAWLPEGNTAKKAISSNANNKNNELNCNILQISPNPSIGNIKVQYELNEKDNYALLTFSTLDGKIIYLFTLSNEKDEILINCNTCISGNYVLSLYINGELHCYKNVSIKK